MEIASPSWSEAADSNSALVMVRDASSLEAARTAGPLTTGAWLVNNGVTVRLTVAVDVCAAPEVAM